MSAPITEAHRELARNIMFYHTPEGSATAQGVRDAAQLIADSEAKACAELRAEVADQVARFHEEIARRQQVVQDNKALDLQERDQLRAELEKVYALVTPDGCDLAPRGLFETARAVTELRAEVERWEAKCHDLIAPHYILDPCLRAQKFRDALAYHPVLT